MPRHLTTRVLLAMAVGVAVGLIAPEMAVQLKFLSDIFVRLVKMVISPIVFLTIVIGIAGVGDLKKVGVLGAKTLVYFELITSIALMIGLLVVSVMAPGAGFDISRVGGIDVSQVVPAGPPPEDFRAFLLNIVPDTVMGAFARGDMLPVLLFAIMFGAVAGRLGDERVPLLATLQRLSHVFFGIIDMTMRISPIAAGAAIAYTVGQFGMGSLLAMAKLMLAVYLTMALFILGVLGLLARFFGFSMWRLLRHIRAEILVVLGTSSSESVLPSVMQKLVDAGCSQSVVGLVIPTGYSFNLDGTAIYLSMATLFIAQAYGVTLTGMQLATTLGVLMVTSKGAAGVTGSGFVTLAATLAAMPGHAVPPEGIALVVGVDRFMSEARAITNLVGNSVATVVLAKHQGEFVSRGVI